jgi:hypothetical protein
MKPPRLFQEGDADELTGRGCSLRREPIQSPIGRTEQRKHLLMKSLQPKHLKVPRGSPADMQEINAFKALKDPCSVVELAC